MRRTACFASTTQLGTETSVRKRIKMKIIIFEDKSITRELYCLIKRHKSNSAAIYGWADAGSDFASFQCN